MNARSIRALSLDECRARLSRADIGRVGVSVGALPAIFPVRFALLGEQIVFRVARGSLLADAATNTIVAFEADSVGDENGPGWSVLVVGRASPIEDGAELEDARRLPLAPWSSHADDQFIGIPAELMSGRDFSRSQVAAQVPGWT